VTFGEQETIDQIAKDIALLVPEINKLLVGTQISANDFVIQSGSTAIVWGCLQHFKENPAWKVGDAANTKRLVFGEGEKKMNDINIWIKGLSINPAKVDGAKCKLLSDILCFCCSAPSLSSIVS
jgi:hypothetical protein